MSVKSIIKNNRLLYKAALITKTVTIKKCMLLLNKFYGVKSNKVVFISFSGKSYSDNPRAISEKLHELNPEFEIVWLFNNPEEKKKIVPSYIRSVKTGSYRSIMELATAKFWIDNFTKPLSTFKSNEQIYIQTWHGDRGFKKILYDSNFVPLNFELLERNICELAISGSDYGDMQYKSAFKYDGKILKEGYPRNDILVKNQNDKSILIKKSLGIELNSKILLYAPTLRRESSSKKANQDIGKIDLIEVLDTLRKKTDKKWICFIRAHSAVTGFSGIPDNENIINVSSYEDMGDLLLISDMLITDYSSSAGDFALLKRPIILFQNDREIYLEKDRTFYFDIDKSPFLVAMSQSEIIKIIEKLDKDMIFKNCEDILKFYGTHETGNASEMVVKYIVSKINEVKQ